MKKLNGIIPPITTPFLNDELALSKLAHNISFLNKIDLSGYVVLGSNGESVYLTLEEKLRLVETTKKLAADDKLIIAGTGSDSIRDTISLSNEAASVGADYVLILTPSFYKTAMKHEASIKSFPSV